MPLLKIVRSSSTNDTTSEKGDETSENSDTKFIRDPVARGIAELKVKKLNGEVLTASIGEMIQMKKKER